MIEYLPATLAVLIVTAPVVGATEIKEKVFGIIAQVNLGIYTAPHTNVPENGVIGRVLAVPCTDVIVVDSQVVARLLNDGVGH